MIFYCTDLAIPPAIMQHVVKVESSGNPYAIGVVGGRLQRQPQNLSEAVATARMLEQKGYNFSLGLAQVNRYNLKKYGLNSYEQAFQICPNLKAGSYILKECLDRARDWGKSFSCYYSGNFVTGYRHGYVQKIFASMGYGNKTVLKSQRSLSKKQTVQKTATVSYFQGNVNSVSTISHEKKNSLLQNTGRQAAFGSLNRDSGMRVRIQPRSSDIIQDKAKLHENNAIAVDSAFVF